MDWILRMLLTYGLTVEIIYEDDRISKLIIKPVAKLP